MTVNRGFITIHYAHLYMGFLRKTELW